MRLVIDLQPCQGDNRHRGIGRYSLSLAKAMADHAGNHEVWLLLNDLAHAEEIEIREHFAGLLPSSHIVVCSMPTGRGCHTTDYTWRVQAEESIRQAFLESLKPDVVHISSLFENLHSHSSVAENSPFPSSVTLYDLIPWMRPEIYLTSPRHKAWYERKLNDLRRAQLLLAISEHTRREALSALSIPEARVVNIAGAADPHFQPIKFSADFISTLLGKFGLTRPYVMYTGGIDPRKNIEGLLQAYALLPQTVRDAHQLAIVCSAQSKEKSRLEQFASGCGLKPAELVLTGYVTDEELVAFYNLCTLFVFPSLHEGLGLPVLEAMACGAPTIAANASSLPEVTGRADALFDPLRPSSIAEKMNQALTDEHFCQSLREHALIQAAKFSWGESARRAWLALENLLEQQKFPQTKTIAPARKRPRLAYVSPLPPERTGIADYSAELLPALAEHYDIDLVVNQAPPNHPAIDNRFRIRTIKWFEENARDFDRILYQFGNSDFHSHMFNLLRLHPGTVVLHDFFLSGVIEWMERVQAKPDFLEQHLRYSHGDLAVEHLSRIGQSRTIQIYPCNKFVLDRAAGVIVHSQHALSLGQSWYGPDFTDEWFIVPPLNTMPAHGDRVSSRARLGLQREDFVVVSFGFISPSKDSHHLLTAWLASSLAKNTRCRLVFVGENHAGKYGEKMLNTIKQAKAGGQVSITGYLPPEDFAAWLSAADLAVQLRRTTRGETSGCVLNCLASGLPIMVNPLGSMAELPPDTAYSLPEEYDTAQLIAALETLHLDTARRARLSATGIEHVKRNLSPAKMAVKYREAIEWSATNSRQAHYQRLIRKVATITDKTPDEDDLAAVSASIAANHPFRGTCRAADENESSN